MSLAPPPLLGTERLSLRAFVEGDSKALLGLFLENQARLRASFPGSISVIVDEAGAAQFIAQKRALWEAHNGFWYGLWERASGELVGQLQVKNLDWEVGRAELAYLLAQSAEGRGLMSEAFGKALDTCFGVLGLQRVMLRTIVGNTRSAALAERFGFRREGTLRKDFRTGEGELVDLHYYARLASDPPPAQGSTR